MVYNLEYMVYDIRYRVRSIWYMVSKGTNTMVSGIPLVLGLRMECKILVFMRYSRSLFKTSGKADSFSGRPQTLLVLADAPKNEEQLHGGHLALRFWGLHILRRVFWAQGLQYRQSPKCFLLGGSCLRFLKSC